MFETIAWNRAHSAEKRRQQRARKLRSGFFVKHLLAGQTLFGCSEPKECIFRVEDGTIRITANPQNGPIETIEEISRGVVFGLGNLDHHIHTAIAVTDSSVSFWPRTALPELTKQDPQTGQRQFDAIEREFKYLRSSIVASTANRPMARVAAFLSYLSHTNATEGRDPEIIDDTVQCHVVADYLKMDIATLEDALRDLERQEIIAYHPPRGLQIRDIVRLDRFAPDL
jgi:CRP/FNR family transcriptional regulator